MIEIKNKTIAVWFSCGAASAVASKLTIDKYGKNNTILLVNNPIKEEHEDNLRFKYDVSKWLGMPIIEARNKDYPNASIVEIFKKRKYMSGVNGAPCTMLLKREARYQFELSNEIDYHVLGFTLDEKHRFDKFIKRERENTLPVLIEQDITKKNCFEILTQSKIKLPLVYKLGAPNANCMGCVKAESPTYWNQYVRKNFPLIFKERAELSRCLGCKLVKYKGKRIFLDELPESAKGGKMNTIECGIFCDWEYV